MNYLITGGAGLIGVHAVKHLLRTDNDAYVVIYDLRPDQKNLDYVMRIVTELGRENDIEVVQGDMLDYDRLLQTVKNRGIEVIIHLAAMLLASGQEAPSKTVKVNVVGMANILDVARETGIAKVVYASTQSVYGPSKDYPDQPVAEEAMLNPRTCYGASKLLCERMAQLYKTRDLAVVGIRPTNAYGFGRITGITGSFNNMIREAALGKDTVVVPPYFGENTKISLVYVEDVARYFCEAARKELEHEIYNLGSRLYVFGEVIEVLQRVFPNTRFEYAKREGEPFLTDYPELDTSRIVRDFGFAPKYSLEQGVRAAAREFLSVEHGN